METLPFRKYIKELIQERRYLKVQYFTDLRELITLDTILFKLDGQAPEEKVFLATGDQVDVTKLVSAGGRFSPLYREYHLYCETCDL